MLLKFMFFLLCGHVSKLSVRELILDIEFPCMVIRFSLKKRGQPRTRTRLPRLTTWSTTL